MTKIERYDNELTNLSSSAKEAVAKFRAASYKLADTNYESDRGRLFYLTASCVDLVAEKLSISCGSTVIWTVDIRNIKNSSFHLDFTFMNDTSVKEATLFIGWVTDIVAQSTDEMLIDKILNAFGGELWCETTWQHKHVEFYGTLKDCFKKLTAEALLD